MDGVKDEDGCPDLDNDQDGVPDAQDKCPTQPETLNGFKDDDGCPDKGSALVVLADDRIEVLEPIMCVESNGKQLLSLPSVMTLKLVAMVMKGHPEIARVRVEVRAAGSKEVAEARAQAVIEALRSQGVEPGRLKPVGLTGAEEGVDFFLERIAPQP
jgi:hypothetical protein